MFKGPLCGHGKIVPGVIGGLFQVILCDYQTDHLRKSV